MKQKPVKEEPPTPVLDSTITSASFISSLKVSLLSSSEELLVRKEI